MSSFQKQANPAPVSEDILQKGCRVKGAQDIQRIVPFHCRRPALLAVVQDILRGYGAKNGITINGLEDRCGLIEINFPGRMSMEEQVGHALELSDLVSNIVEDSIGMHRQVVR